jgi:hypothetical protein
MGGASGKKRAQVLWESLKERDHSEDQDIDRRMA